MSYDRRINEGLLAALKPRGWAHSLVEFGKAGQFALDLQLRANPPKTKETRATLYVGLTKVAELFYLPSKGFRLDAHETYKTPHYGWHISWEKWQSSDKLEPEWADVDLYLERIIPAIGGRFLKEGSVQAAICGFTSEHMLVIDREAAVTYTNQAEKDRVKAELERPLLTALSQPGRREWWRTLPPSLGGECDALALGLDGSLFAIEIKPRSATSTIRWSPLQVRHYARLFSKWASEMNDLAPGRAEEVINGMVKQREQLGLIAANQWRIKTPIKVKAMVAIGRGYNINAIAGLREVQERLAEEGFNDPPLTVKEATLWGRLDDVHV